MAGWCEKGIQMLFAIVGAFGAFGLMAIAIGTDYWLYSKAKICNSTNGTAEEEKKDKKDLGSLTHSGLWRVCCLEGLRRGSCQKINHFPEDTDYDHDSAEYILRIVRASSIFPILSAILLLLGGVCIATSRLYKSKRNIILGSGILFVAAGLSNIIGVIVYISANAGDPSTKRDEDKRFHYSYGWSFYFGGLSFLLAETVGVLVVHIYIERSKESRSRARSRSRSDLLDTPSQLALPAYRFRYGPRPGSGAIPSPPSSPSGPPSPRSSASSTSSSPSQAGGLPPPPLGLAHPPTAPGTPLAPSAPPDISMFTLTREQAKGHGEGLGPMGERGSVAPPPPPTFLQLHNCPGKGDGPGEGSNSGTLNRKTTPV